MCEHRGGNVNKGNAMAQRKAQRKAHLPAGQLDPIFTTEAMLWTDTLEADMCTPYKATTSVVSAYMWSPLSLS